MHPISIKQRSRCVTPIIYPASPAFVYNYRTKKDPNMKNMVEYCAQKNVPFTLEEEKYYKLL